MRDDLAEMFQRHSETADGGVSFAGEYLVLIGHRQDT